jgi:hypothetical protein
MYSHPGSVPARACRRMCSVDTCNSCDVCSSVRNGNSAIARGGSCLVDMVRPNLSCVGSGPRSPLDQKSASPSQGDRQRFTIVVTGRVLTPPVDYRPRATLRNPRIRSARAHFARHASNRSYRNGPSLPGRLSFSQPAPYISARGDSAGTVGNPGGSGEAMVQAIAHRKGARFRVRRSGVAYVC